MSDYLCLHHDEPLRNPLCRCHHDLVRRVFEHKSKLMPGFTSRYNITRLVYFEATGDIQAAIAREKRIKGWLRAKKLALIEAMNPEWKDLSEEWCHEGDSSLRSE